MRAALFYDIGFVSSGSYQFSAKKDPNGSGGLNSNYGIPMQSDRFNNSGGKFQFNIGYKY